MSKLKIPLFRYIEIVSIISTISFLVVTTITDVIAGRFGERDALMIGTLVWVLLYLYRTIELTATYYQREQLSTVISKMLDSIAVIRNANENGVPIQELERQGLFHDVQMAIETLTGQKTRKEEDDHRFHNIRNKTVN